MSVRIYGTTTTTHGGMGGWKDGDLADSPHLPVVLELPLLLPPPPPPTTTMTPTSIEEVSCLFPPFAAFLANLIKKLVDLLSWGQSTVWLPSWWLW